ncbi:Uncharacterised protein [Wolbachia endosymbiont wPip_Mol of Culex molestus]|nr:Uncharacterised protein [Wolbachia endosymbiont wPip_Mol of Culex molestus]
MPVILLLNGNNVEFAKISSTSSTFSSSNLSSDTFFNVVASSRALYVETLLLKSSLTLDMLKSLSSKGKVEFSTAEELFNCILTALANATWPARNSVTACAGLQKSNLLIFLNLELVTPFLLTMLLPKAEGLIGISLLLVLSNKD